MTQNLKFKSVRVTKVAFTAIASILSIALVYAQELQNPKEHNTKVYDVSFSPDGKLLASGSGDGTVKLWDAAIGKELNTLKGHSDRIYSVNFSPDG
ncbi:MAG: WD40 repeat domain-containing protein, partial [Nostoc sp.]